METNFIRSSKIYFTLALLLVSALAHSQEMLWSSCSVNTGLELTFKTISVQRQEICVGGTAGQMNYRTEQAGLFSSDGSTQIDEYAMSRAGNYMFIYSFSGDLKWHYYSPDREDRIYGATYDNTNELVALVYMPLKRPRNHYYYDSDQEVTDDEEDDSDDDEDRYCYKLCWFDSTGDNFKTIAIEELLDADITDFKAHPNGGFVLAGHADGGRFTKNINLNAGKGGCDFLIYVDAKGKIIWGDALAYQKESCCTYGADPEVAFDSKGNTLLAGSYVGGARFGGSIIKLAVVPYGAGPYYTAMEAYVASYSPEGKFRWVQTAGSLSYFGSVTAGNGNIYLATSMSRREGKMFGAKVDTTNHENVFVTILDENGKVKSNISCLSKSRVNVALDAEGNLVITGTIGINAGFLKHEEAAPGQRRKLEDVYVAFYNKNGKYIEHHEYNMLRISSDEGPECFAISKDQYFLTGELFGGLPLSLRILEPAFPDVKIYGSGTMVAGCGKKK